MATWLVAASADCFLVAASLVVAIEETYSFVSLLVAIEAA